MKTLVVITGAANGIGAAIYSQLKKSLETGSYFLLFDKDNIDINNDTIIDSTNQVKCKLIE